MSASDWAVMFIVSLPFFVAGWAAGERRILGPKGAPALAMLVVFGCAGIYLHFTNERFFATALLRLCLVGAAACFAYGYWDTEDLRNDPKRQISFLGQTFEMGCLFLLLAFVAALIAGVLMFISRA